MSIRVQLQQFEGPLDLLLYLIRKEEMDIFNINIVEITKQYFDYIKLMKEFDLEVAGDFIAMASTLIHIKSKMLLPQYDENGEVVEQDDPRKELVQKLLEYEKYKEAAKSLYDRPLLNRDVWARGLREKLEVSSDEIELEDNALFSLIGSYRKAMKTLNKKIHKVTVKLQSISSRIIEMSHFLKPGHTVRMIELLTNQMGTQVEKSRQALITFLSLLELGKLGFVSLYQTDLYGDIHIQTNKVIDGDVLSRVEEYGNINADNVTQKSFATTTPSVDEEFSNEVQMAFSEEMGTSEEVLDEEILTEIASDEEILAEELNLNISDDENFPEEQA
ncbi:MAG: segregation/condensation protein A [Bdellovibrio sp.]|nr:segregation/condensation protein A [Bdellovibrio sp.]